MIKIAMFDTKEYDKQAFEQNPLSKDFEMIYFDTKLTINTVGLTQGCDGVIVFVNDMLDNGVIDLLYKNGVKLIALRCAGYNNVDVRAAYEKIHIVRVPAYSPYAVAEHTMALLLTLVRRTHKAYIRTKDFNFSLNGMMGFNLHGKTVGIVGTGKIGCVLADICRGFGMRVLAFDPFPKDLTGVEYVELEHIWRESDIISLHCPLSDENYHMINSGSISTMKDGVVIVNTSRGALIDSDDLLDAIKSKKIGGACLDVYEEESDIFFEDNSGHILKDDILARLLTMPNVIITSHQAFLTDEALNNIAQTTLDNMNAFFKDNQLNNEVCYHCGEGEQCRQERKTQCF